ncbi:MAG: GNAT family N-acetyltransferase [Bacteroidetes bacterium]|nr:GNAT family N-acetyltransferase [Bacteroidota bacterium]
MNDAIQLDALPGLQVRILGPDDAGILSAYLERNIPFHRQWSPVPPPGFFTEEVQRERLIRSAELRRDDREYRFGVFSMQTADSVSGGLIGTITLTNIVRGVFQNGCLGYSVDAAECNRGVTTSALRAVIRHAFTDLELHRLEANVLPRNAASRRVLLKCGFTHIGRSPRMLKINGVWEDHDMFMILADAPSGTAA